MVASLHRCTKEMVMPRAPFTVVMGEIDALPEGWGDPASEEGRTAYRAAVNRVLGAHGWTFEDFDHEITVRNERAAFIHGSRLGRMV
jgi:hypothetical protein